MDQLHATLHKAAQSVRRDPHEAAAFRRTLDALTSTPAAAAPARGFLSRPLAWALVAILVAGSGATVTYASTRAIPGDALYAMKVKVVEPAESALALSAEAEADIAVAHMERRFQEAAALSAAGTLETHDDELAAASAKDLAVVDSDAQPIARARLEALASVYAPSIRIKDLDRSRFALATRLAVAAPRIEDAVAKAAAREQLAIATQRSLVTRKANVSADVAARLKAAERYSAAANLELDKGAFQAAFKLSGDAVRIATEAQVIAGIAASSTATTSVATASSTATTTVTSTASSSVRASSSAQGSGFRALFR